MPKANPFAPVPTARGDKPLVVRRDRRAVNLEEHISSGQAVGRLSSERVRIRFGVIFLLVTLAMVTARVAYLQVIRGDTYRVASERNRTRLETLRAPRGIIFDRNQNPLLMNVPNFTLIATPADLPRSVDERQSIVVELAAVLKNLNLSTLSDTLVNAPTTSLEPLILAEHLSHDDAIRASTVIARLPGISVETVSTRSYIDAQAAAHVIGYLGKPTQSELDGDSTLSTISEIGRMGVEQSYDQLLRGTDGVREVERDHLNKELQVLRSRNPIPGNNLVLSIDQGLQDTLFSSLQRTVDDLRVPGGAAVAIDPRSGEIRALVSYPSFNPNLFTTGGSKTEFESIFSNPNHPLFFRAVSGSYPSGSTIKPVVASAGLAEKTITERTIVQSTGGIRIGASSFPDWKAGGHGSTDVRKALAESVNTFFYTVGGGYGDIRGLGVDRLVEYFSLFGLGEKLGIDLPNESNGFLPTKSWRDKPTSPRWYLGDTYHLAIGQGYIDVTPLQVASFTATIANGGTLYRPHVLSKILNPDGSTLSTIAPDALRSTVSSNVLAIIRSGMRQAVTSGSARALADLPVPAAAKTGTAQFGEGDRTHAWLTSFAPFDRPEIVIAVVIEQGGEGHAEALPVAKDGLRWYFSHQPDTP